MRVVSIARKPFEGNVPLSCLLNGTGALNIDAARIRHLDPSEPVRNSVGRWPSNLVVAHHPECKQIGVEEDSYTINRWVDGAKPFGGGAGHDYSSHVLSNKVPVWCCHSSCVSRDLNQQARENTAKYFKQLQSQRVMDLPEDLFSYLQALIETEGSRILFAEELSSVDWSSIHDESLHGAIFEGHLETYAPELWRCLKPGAYVFGIAPEDSPTGYQGICTLEDQGFEIRDSIFVVQEPGRAHYVPKPSRKEKNEGIAPFEVTVEESRLFPQEEKWEELEEELSELFDEEQLRTFLHEGVPSQSIPKPLKSLCIEKVVKVTKTQQNSHLTVKPLALLRRLLRGLPNASVVLDPFMGSGSTGVACVEEGHHFTGIELESPSLQTSEERIRYATTSKLRPWTARVESEAEKPKRKKMSFLPGKK